MSEVIYDFVRTEDNHMQRPWAALMPPEVTCPICGEKIAWCLDMFSFTTGDFGVDGGPPPFTLAHARCVWTPEAFDKQKRHQRVLKLAKGKTEVGIRKAAKILEVHENTVRNWINKGDLPAVEMTGKSGFRKILVSELLMFNG